LFVYVFSRQELTTGFVLSLCAYVRLVVGAVVAAPCTAERRVSEERSDERDRERCVCGESVLTVPIGVSLIGIWRSSDAAFSSVGNGA
jgi:hypothetical protein